MAQVPQRVVSPERHRMRLRLVLKQAESGSRLQARAALAFQAPLELFREFLVLPSTTRELLDCWPRYDSHPHSGSGLWTAAMGPLRS